MVVVISYLSCHVIRNPARPTFFPSFDKSHYDKRHSSSTNGQTVYVETQPVAWKDRCVYITGVTKPGHT